MVRPGINYARCKNEKLATQFGTSTSISAFSRKRYQEPNEENERFARIIEESVEQLSDIEVYLLAIAHSGTTIDRERTIRVLGAIHSIRESSVSWFANAEGKGFCPF